MPDNLNTKNRLTFGAVVAATLISGAAAGRLSAPVPSSTARPVMVRWLNDGVDKPTRYAVTIVTKLGANDGQREIVCEADGNQPKLNGRPFDNDSAKALCDVAAKNGASLSSIVAKLAEELTR